MAEIKKYLDTTGLGQLVENIKAEDAAVLQGAKDYADGLASNYEVAGAAATAKSEAIAAAKTETENQVKALADGAVKTNTDAITAIKDGASIDSFADVEAALAGKQATGDYATKAEAQGYADAKDTAIAAAQAAADKAQDEVDALADFVGELPSGVTATTVIGYVQEKTSGIASEGAMNELTGRVAQAETDIDNIEKDYLKAADKEELQGKIDAVNDAVELLSDGVDAEKVDGVKDLIAYVEEHGTEVTGMKEDISDNADAISGVSGRVDVLEAKFGGAEGSVEDMIADAKAEAIATAGTNADAKDAEILAQAKKYADDEDAKIEARVDALEAVDHEHGNFDLLETYTQTEANLADAVAKKHEHSNLSVLEGITADLVSKWGAAEQNAKDYADGLNTTMQSTVNGIDDRVKVLETASATHALASDLTAAVNRIAANETAIAANTSAINSFTAITTGEVDALFA